MSNENNASNDSINYSWDLTKEKPMDLLSELEALKETVVTTVTDSNASNTVINAINDEKKKISAVYKELCLRGKQSDAYKFIAKCISRLMDFMHKVIGHIKNVWAYVQAWFNKLGSKQLEMSV